MAEMDQKTEPAVGAPAPTALAGNPLLEDWTGSGVPPFSRIAAEHFPAAYARAFAEHETQIAAIASDPAPPTLANTIDLLERSGQSLERIDNLFHLLAGATADDALLAVEREMAPRLARHWNKVRTNATLFRRIDAVRQAADRLGLDAEQKRVVERYHTNYRRAGAALEEPARQRLAEIMERLAALGTAFSHNVLADEQAFALPLQSEAELAGLPDFIGQSLRSEAVERGLDGHAVTLSRSIVEPFLQFSERRDLREKVFRGFVMRGDNGGATDNKAIIAEMVRLRAIPARRCNGENARRGPRLAWYRLAAGSDERACRSRRDAGVDPGGRRQLQARGVGLAVLCREAAQAPLPFRRGCGQALSVARSNDRGDLLRGNTAVRVKVHAVARRAGLAPRCPGLAGVRRRRPRDRPVLRRLFRAAVQAQRRLDDRAAQPAKARRQDYPAHCQRLQFRQGGGR